MFSRLQTRLTVLYAAMFGAVLLALSSINYFAVAGNAQHIVEGGLTSAGQVFDRLWAVRAERLREGARLLSKDFGFREALGTHDMATIDSAVDNLRERLGLDLAFVVDADGRPIGAADPKTLAAAGRVGAVLAADGDAQGVFIVGGAPYELVSAPILSPDPKGWIVFAVRLDGRQMEGIEKLSAIPLRASVAQREAGGRWSAVTTAAGLAHGAALNALIAGSLKRNGAFTGPGAEGATMTLARPLPGVDSSSATALVLSYPLAEALAPYRLLLWLCMAVGVVGMALVAWGSWLLARSVTRPLSALTRAAQDLQQGEAASVPVTSRDEVGALAQGFNAMAEAVRQREATIRHAALHDSETGLANREGLARAAGELAQRAGGRAVHVVALSVDRFAQMRGSIGYHLAAELLRTLGERLAARGEDVAVGRLASDSLGVAMLADDDAHAFGRAAAARAELDHTFTVGDHLIDVRARAGLSSAGHPGADAARLIKEAELAVDEARAAGLDLAAFDPVQAVEAADRLSLMPELRRAIARNELAVVHQPKQDLRSGAIVGVETLVRWAHPRRGAVPPDVFVGMAEETGDIRALTEWVLARALADQKTLADAGHALPFAINLSGRLVGDIEFCSEILRMCAGAAGRIRLEITETAVIADPKTALANIRRFAAAGVGVSIDDYGSGLSSLAYLKQIEADELKLDKVLIDDMASSGKDALLVRSTIELAHALGLKVTAEGVEDAASLALLTGMGCDLVQGYFIARPMTLDSLRSFLEASAPANADAAISRRIEDARSA